MKALVLYESGGDLAARVPLYMVEDLDDRADVDHYLEVMNELSTQA